MAIISEIGASRVVVRGLMNWCKMSNEVKHACSWSIEIEAGEATYHRTIATESYVKPTADCIVLRFGFDV